MLSFLYFFVYFCILTLASLKPTPIPHGVEASMMSSTGEYFLSIYTVHISLSSHATYTYDIIN